MVQGLLNEVSGCPLFIFYSIYPFCALEGGGGGGCCAPPVVRYWVMVDNSIYEGLSTDGNFMTSDSVR